jgi:alkyl sulfatase BDS1-like metallo-beta-lactamase superfamily hydrolase
VREVYRSESGWWDRNPTTLHPAHPRDAAVAVLEAISDRGFVLDKARILMSEGQLQLALHVIDLLALAPGDDKEVREARALKAELLKKRAKDVPSFVSKNLLLTSADRLETGA